MGQVWLLNRFPISGRPTIQELIIEIHELRFFGLFCRENEVLMKRDQRWFELRDKRTRSMDRDTWIVLRATRKTQSGTERFGEGHEEEYFGAASAAIPNAQREVAARTVSWGNLSLMHDHAPCVQNGVYEPADQFKPYPGELSGTYLVLCQRGSSIEQSDWLVHPDLILGLHLKREGDNWLAMDEGYEPVIRMSRNETGSPALIEIRSSHLKDFLAAKNEFLCVSTYRSRELIVSARPAFTWNGNPFVEVSASEKWQGSITEITENGHQYGSTMAILHVGRKDFDLEQDVPEIGVSDEITTRQFTRKFEGKKLFRIGGELWKVEFIEPGEHSVRLRGDDLASSIFFYTDASGRRESAEVLDRKGRWLWFKPDVMNTALEYRGSALEWYTADTGRISMGPDGGVHFGVNSLGLVNVYAKDIRNSPAWQQQIWAGFNVVPDGGVSRELLMAQAEGEPARTQAPEPFLKIATELLNRNSMKMFGFEAIKPHSERERMIRLAHRFRALDEAGFYALSKDLARLTADSFDVAALQKIAPVPKGEKRGSLKSLESVMATLMPAETAHALMTPLFGIYELRLADAHLPSSELDTAFTMVNVNRNEPWIIQGTQLMCVIVDVLHHIAYAFDPKARGEVQA
jgi:hypothetical protein